jgi:hypothetical protein
MGLVSLFWVFVGVGAVSTTLVVVLGFVLVALEAAVGFIVVRCRQIHRRAADEIAVNLPKLQRQRGSICPGSLRNGDGANRRLFVRSLWKIWDVDNLSAPPSRSISSTASLDSVSITPQLPTDFLDSRDWNHLVIDQKFERSTAGKPQPRQA